MKDNYKFIKTTIERAVRDQRLQEPQIKVILSIINGMYAMLVQLRLVRCDTFSTDARSSINTVAKGHGAA